MSGIASPYQGYELFQLFGDRKVAIAPTAFYLAFFTTEPDDSGLNGVEVSTSNTGYSRRLIPNDSIHWLLQGGNVSNTQLIQYPVGTVNWGTVTGWALLLGPDVDSAMFLWGEATGSLLYVDGFPVLVFPDNLEISSP